MKHLHISFSNFHISRFCHIGRNIHPVFRGTLETYMKRAQTALRLRTTISGSHNVLSHVEFQPTTLWRSRKPADNLLNHWDHLAVINMLPCPTVSIFDSIYLLITKIVTQRGKWQSVYMPSYIPSCILFYYLILSFICKLL